MFNRKWTINFSLSSTTCDFCHKEQPLITIASLIRNIGSYSSNRIRPISAVEKHEYEVLKGREFRLLLLFPGKDGEDVKVELQKYSIEHAPLFEALSYEWSRYLGYGSVLCKEKLITVTHNLLYALQSLRFTGRPRMLWVDALCIDQDDLDERSSQVSLMREIYSTAAAVIIWLGNSAVIKNRTVELLNSLALLAFERSVGCMDHDKIEKLKIMEMKRGKSFYRTSVDQRLPTASDGYYVLHRKLGQTDDAIFYFNDETPWRGAWQIFTDSYFGRTWVIQEVAVANKIIVAVGRQRFPWEVLDYALAGWLLLSFHTRYFKPRGFSEDHGAFMRVLSTRQEYRSSKDKLELLPLLATSSKSKSTLPQDRIFGVVGLVREGYTVETNYDRAPEDLFTETTTHIITQHRNLSYFSYHMISPSSLKLRMPSWVPDFISTANTLDVIEGSRRLKDCIRGTAAVEKGKLFVDAHILDEIEVIFLVSDLKDLEVTFANVESHFNGKQKGFFDCYVAETVNPLPKCDLHAVRDRIWQETKEKATDIIEKWPAGLTLPHAVRVLLENPTQTPHENDNLTLIIEALQMCITKSAAQPAELERGSAPGLAYLALRAFEINLRRDKPLIEALPKSYRFWISMVKKIRRAYDEEPLGFFDLPSLILKVKENTVEYDNLFISKMGYIGRAPARTLSTGQKVAILSGAPQPMLLEKIDGYYRIVSSAYVEGIDQWTDLPKPLQVERIELR